MKAMCLVAVLVAGLFGSGCATPAYSAHERWQLISRNWAFEWKQVQDDVDHLLMLRPSSNLTIWHIR